MMRNIGINRDSFMKLKNENDYLKNKIKSLELENVTNNTNKDTINKNIEPVSILEKKKAERLKEIEIQRKKEKDEYLNRYGLNDLQKYKEMIKALNVSEDLLKKYNIFN